MMCQLGLASIRVPAKQYKGIISSSAPIFPREKTRRIPSNVKLATCSFASTKLGADNFILFRFVLLTNKAMSTKRQSNLSSFFGGATKKAPLKSKKEKPSKSSSKAAVSSSTPSKAKRDDDGSLTPISPLPKSKARTKKKEIKKDFMTETKDDDSLMDTDDEDVVIGKKHELPSSTSPEENGGGPHKKKRIIIDDSSDDEAEELDVEETKVENRKEEEQSSKEEDDEEEYKEADEPSDDDEEEEELVAVEDEKEEEEVDVKVSSLSKKPSKSEPKPKKNALSALKAPSSKSTNKTKNTKKSTSAAQSIPTDDEIKSMLDSKKWKLDKKGNPTPMPYSLLCQTLSEIEAISSRLEIQRHLTNLFRLCILQNPKDLITLLYLSSNTVAAAYECVELGIGDAILIKAVGEACGSNPSIVKQKYKSDGDLGTVAQNAKGKLGMLGFGIKPKPLAAEEVLNVFRQIATTSGSQSQKKKVDMIKGLLNRAESEGFESKFIVRGLQGKLRIGLAQSTVLISLGHAILLSKTQEEEEVKKSKEVESPDNALSQNSINVINTKLPLESRLEAAVNIVRKAYSEVPSFDALSEAILSVPLSRLHEACTLRPGLPVEPMLAKPTKSVQEVLKRLNGKRFTCEYKYDGERAQVHMKQDGVTKVGS